MLLALALALAAAADPAIQETAPLWSILELRFLERRSLRDSADAMGISVGNAKVLQHRALRMAAAVGEAET